MRKLIASINITLDGFMAGPDCGLDWHFRYWDEEMAYSTAMQLAEMDTIIFGRNTYLGMAAYWSSMAFGDTAQREDIAFADMLTEYQKVVFSRTIAKAPWKNSLLVRSNLERAVRHLKKQEGKDIILYGSCRLLHRLQQLQLVDEYRLWLHPVTIGKGKPLFKHAHPSHMRLYRQERFASGVLLLCYRTCLPASVRSPVG